MNLTSSHLEAFYAVSQTLNFTKAAERLHITQSALSQRILNFEKELELTLFIRDRSGLRLTEAATKLVRYCQQKNSLELELLASLKPEDVSGISGTVRIGGFSSVMSSLVIPALAKLASVHQNVQIQTSTKEMNELFATLKRGEIDYILVDDRIDREELVRVSLGKEKNVLVQHKKYHGEVIYLDHDESDDVTLKYLRQAKIKTKEIKRQYLDDIHGLLSGVENKLGRAVLPLHLIKDDRNLEILHPEHVLEIPISLYYYSQPYYSKLHFKVVEVLQSTFAELLV